MERSLDLDRLVGDTSEGEAAAIIDVFITEEIELPGSDSCRQQARKVRAPGAAAFGCRHRAPVVRERETTPGRRSPSSR